MSSLYTSGSLTTVSGYDKQTPNALPKTVALGATVPAGDLVQGYSITHITAVGSHSPVTLPINACAWSGSGGPIAGDVTFVIRGGL